MWGSSPWMMEEMLEEEEECVDPVPPASGSFVSEARLQGGGGVWE